MQNEPGQPRARRLWPLAHDILSYMGQGRRTHYAFSHAERAWTAARAADLAPCESYLAPTE
eukprot:5702467-Pyramimonas_sp.AAC.1